jgi:hypothetical protein
MSPKHSHGVAPASGELGPHVDASLAQLEGGVPPVVEGMPVPDSRAQAPQPQHAPVNHAQCTQRPHTAADTTHKQQAAVLARSPTPEGSIAVGIAPYQGYHNGKLAQPVVCNHTFQGCAYALCTQFSCVLLPLIR